MMDMAVKEKAANEAAKQNKIQSVAILANKAADCEADPIDEALGEFALREELAGLDRVSILMRKKALADRYGITPKDIVDCWKDLKNPMDNGEEKIKQTPAEKLIEELSANDPKEPWPDDVEMGALIKETANTIKQFIVFKSIDQAYACALWVIASWFVDYVSFAPYILISAPMKQCGKSQLLKCLSNLSKRPLLASNVSTSVLFRMIEMAKPTLFIDEVDTFLKNDQELIGIINAGIERDGAKAYRNEKTADGSFVPTSFDCFAFKALSGIASKNISETITDRSIVIELQRKDVKDVKKKLREVDPKSWFELKRKFLKAVEQYGEVVKKSRPVIPDFLSDRDGDKWSSLFAIADVANDTKARDYFRLVAKSLKFKDEDSVSVSYELLHDIRDILENAGYTPNARISTKELLDKLISDEELAWRTWNRGNPFTPKQLAKRLRDFDIKPRKFKYLGSEFRGYEVPDFKDAFERYLSNDKEG